MYQYHKLKHPIPMLNRDWTFIDAINFVLSCFDDNLLIYKSVSIRVSPRLSACHGEARQGVVGW